MSSGDEQSEKECPLCMEPLELDDINFYPCKCEYQICRFCWHRIRTDENGLCPACRQPYPEDPANFKPLSTEELQRIKNEKKQKQQQHKQKISESRKHLANLRVLQKNLVYVVGLAPRIADAETLKKPEYFGKFGRIHKVVVGSATSGAQSSSSTAYVTYYRPEDALRAIQNVNNLNVDGRTVRASLGTTKYCSSYLRNQPCHKTDCMYLHDVAEEEASFTKEDMQQGKHTEYERRLHEQMLSQLQQYNRKSEGQSAFFDQSTELKENRMPGIRQQNPPPRHRHRQSDTKESSVDGDEGGETDWKQEEKAEEEEEEEEAPVDWPGRLLAAMHQPANQSLFSQDEAVFALQAQAKQTAAAEPPTPLPLATALNRHVNGLRDSAPRPAGPVFNGAVSEHSPVVLSGAALKLQSQTDWQAAFGLKPSTSEQSQSLPSQTSTVVDDLGFDPFSESSKGLADLLEQERERERKERTRAASMNQRWTYPATCAGTTFRHLSPAPSLPSMGLSPVPSFTTPPPGFPPQFEPATKLYQNGPLFSYNGVRQPQSMMAGLGREPSPTHLMSRPLSPHPASDAFSLQEWQDGLKSLFPNVNIHFAPNLAPPPKSNWLNGGRGPPPGPPFTQPPPPISVATNGPLGCPPMRPSPPGNDPYSVPPPPLSTHRPTGALPPPGFPGGAWPPPPGFSPRQQSL